MRGHSRSLSIPVLMLLSVAALVATGATGANPTGCSARSTYDLQLGTAGHARASTLHAYDDYIEDVVTAPDICASNLMTNDNLGAITIGLHIHDRDRFSAGDGYSVFFDTDSNAATGSVAGTADPVGAEYELEIKTGSSSLWRWNGASFEPATTQASLTTIWIEGYGPALELNRKDLGDAQAFRFVFVTSNGADLDLAPDYDMWSYELSPLELTAGKLVAGPAKAGKRFVAAMYVERSDFEIALEEGRIACAAKLGGKPLAGKGVFADERVACSWRIPASARGKRLSGGVSVEFQGATAKRAFSVRVK